MLSNDLVATVDLKQYMQKRRTLLPDKLKCSGHYKNHYVSYLIDGDLQNSYWCDKRQVASTHFIYNEPILFDCIEIYYYMKKNEKRYYSCNVYNCEVHRLYKHDDKVEYGEEGTNLEYELLFEDISNEGMKHGVYQVSNFNIVNDELIKLSKIDNLLFMFTNTSSRKGYYAIIQIMIKGTLLSEVLVPETEPLMQQNNILP